MSELRAGIGVDVRLNESDGQLIETREDYLHQLIASGNLECLNYVEILDKSKVYLNSKNKSALYTAIESRQFEVYALLREKQLQFKNELEKRVIWEMKDDEKNGLAAVIAKLFPPLKDSSVLYLLSKSRKSNGKMDHAIVEKMEKYYRKLRDDYGDAVKVILDVVQHCDCLNIVYDYDSDHVFDINPTVSRNVKGLTCLSDGRIYIAAKVNEDKLLGTVIHELTHLAMNIVFENDCNPYKAKSDEEKEFEVIVKSLRSRKDNNLHKILIGAFRNYGETYWPRELIARVPQMLVNCGGYESELTVQAEDLFTYYKNYVIRKCQNFVDGSYLIKSRNTVVCLNNYSGVLNNIVELNIKFDCPISMDDKRILIFNTPSTLLTLSHLHQSLNLPSSEFLLFNYQRLQMNVMNVKEAMKSPICQLLIIEISNNSLISDEILRSICHFIAKNTTKRLILIVDAQQCEQLTIKIKNIIPSVILCCHVIDGYSLHHFNEETTGMFLAKTIHFQSNQIKLKKLIDCECDECLNLVDSQTLTKLLENNILSVGKTPALSVDFDEDFYIPRSFKFISDPNNTVYLSESDLVSGVNEFPTILISEAAGMGKTTFLSRMTQLIRGYWLIRVDLNNFTAILEREVQCRSFDSNRVDEALKFFIEILLSSQPETKLETNFEIQLLSHFIKDKQKVIVLFDGFDEISPNYKDVVIDLILTLQKTRVKQIWVTTRTHMQKELEEKLNIVGSLQMLLFNQSNQTHFLVKFWSKTLAINLDEAKLRIFADNLISSMAKSIKDYELKFTGIPLQTQMLAVIYTNDVKTFIESNEQLPEVVKINSIAELYEKFVDAKFKIRENEKKKNSKGNVLTELDGKYLKSKYVKNHEIAGVYALMDYRHISMCLTDRDVDKCIAFMNEISNGSENGGLIVGVDVYEFCTMPKFVHRTFAEYFASRLIWHKIYPNEHRLYSFNDLISVNYFYQNNVIVFIDNYIGNLNLHKCHCNNNQPLLIDAVQWNKLDVIKVLVEKYKFDPNVVSCVAEEFNEYSPDEVVEYSPSDYIFNTIKRYLRTPLLIAIKKGNKAIVDYFINNCHCNVDGDEENRIAPLHVAAYFGQVEMVKNLIEIHGANPFKTVENGLNALHFASLTSLEPFKKIFDYLIEECELNVDGEEDGCSYSPIHIMAESDQIDKINYCVNKYKANINKVSSDGRNALNFAVSRDHYSIIEYLVNECHLDLNSVENAQEIYENIRQRQLILDISRRLAS
ncbi:hypothetical protein CHUAL_004208 [Chamberlinius hualienensis]